MGLLNIEAGLWADRIVDSYAARARPEMTEDACDGLLDWLAIHLSPAVKAEAICDWPEAANHALDAWEDKTRTRGPRVAAFDDTIGTVHLWYRG